jgi:hypothetical protein
MTALKGLHAALLQVHAEPSKRALRGEDGHSDVRLLVDAQPAALWRYAQWVIATAASPQTKIYKLAFSSLVPGGWIDNQLPRDNEGRFNPVTVKPDATLLEVKLFRRNLDRPEAERFTRIRISSSATFLDGIPEEVEVTPGEPPAPANASTPDLTIDLPVADAPSGLHAARWRKIEAELRNRAKKDLPCVGEVKTPFPTGLGVQYADVAAVFSLLHAVGCKRTLIEGAPAPVLRKEGGGWAFDDAK